MVRSESVIPLLSEFGVRIISLEAEPYTSCESTEFDEARLV